ncbi:MAG TPA: amidase family protein [Kribbella sp.]|uniref:amidase family protein n=1 Tax=Kribbella sp. TaxID=1871183 RepID=UPI002D77AF26|nr:amidase family protein [Kribbella sp.]HET6294159.1 amidase family protein [Kribbella sp.]
MHRVPDLSDIKTAAERLGVGLTTEEAEVYRRHLDRMLSEFDGFVQARGAEVRPPRFPGAREPGYRPSADEDPHNAWTWKCSIYGSGSGILTGRTVSFKDHTAVAGMPMSFGAQVLSGHVPDFDATVVQRSLEAGATVVGKNVMNGLAGGFGFGGGVGDFGRPLNPHNPDHLTGGSSSGSAAALVDREVDISFGGDQGGSIRIPASWSGTVGHKPTFGLISHFGIGFGSDQSIDYTGPMTMSVLDAALALEAVAGYDGLDPRQTREVPDRYDATSGLTGDIEGLRIGILREGFLGATEAVADSVQQAIEVFEKLGAVVSEVSVPEHLTIGDAQAAMSAESTLAVRGSGFYGAFARTFYPEDTIATITRAWQHNQELLDPRGLLNLMAGEFSRRYWAGRLYAKAMNARPAYIAAYDRALAEVDVLVMPTTITQAPKFQPPADYGTALDYALQSPVSQSAVANTRPFNFTGHPALAVPCEKRDGLPVSIQLVGRMFDDALLLKAAHAFTKATPFEEWLAVDAA